LWDNKLPSIYLVNELWQLLFGAHYGLHTADELVVNGLTIGLFALLLRRYHLAGWPWVTACFAVVLVVLPAEYDFTEFYALPLILGALIALDMPLIAGICLALATTFWIPSALVAVAICVLRARPEWLVRFAAGGLAVVLPYAFVVLLGPHTISALAATWPAHIKQGGASLATSRLGFIRSLYGPLLSSGAGLCIALFLVFIRRPGNEAAQRLAIGWIAAALVGTVITGHPSAHYFVPALGALMFGVAAFAGPSLAPYRAVPRLLAATAAMLLLFVTIPAAYANYRDVSIGCGQRSSHRSMHATCIWPWSYHLLKRIGT
jgi:hypothetical protein